MEKVRWGIIGCGDVTEAKSGPALQRAEGSALVAVMRRNAALAEDYAKRHAVPKWYDDAAALIADPQVDAVYVATPPAFHKEYAIMAAQAGKPVYVEKPMAMNTEECEAMLAACRQAGVPLFVAYYRRVLPRFVKVKELLDNGAIGEVRFVRTQQTARASAASAEDQANWRVQPELSGGGLFLDLASHTLDLYDHLLGPIRKTSGTASNQAGLYAAEDIVTGEFAFESGVHGVGAWCFSAYRNEDLNEIVGTRGKITFATFADQPVVLTTEEGVREFAIAHPAHVQQPLIQTVVNELLGRGSAPSTGETAIRTSRVMDAMITAYYRGR